MAGGIYRRPRRIVARKKWVGTVVAAPPPAAGPPAGSLALLGVGV